MAAIDFPLSPTNGQQFLAAGVTWTWDGVKWTALGNNLGIPDAPPDGQLYGRKNASWALATGGGGGISDAPTDGTAYARKSGGWVHLTHTDITDWAATLANYYPVGNPSGYQTAAQVAAAIPAPYVLPNATTTVLGGVKVDGTTVTATAGVISATGGVTISATAPSTPIIGQLWWDIVGGQMYVWYNDGNSSQWVVANNQQGPTGPQGPAGSTGATGPSGPNTMPPGVTNGSNATAGQIGEYLLIGAAAQGLTTAVDAVICSLPLTPGDWDVSGEGSFQAGGGAPPPVTFMKLVITTGTTMANGQISTSTMAQAGGPCPSTNLSNVGNPLNCFPVGPFRVNISAPATYNLVMRAMFASGTCLAAGYLSARRMR